MPEPRDCWGVEPRQPDSEPIGPCEALGDARVTRVCMSDVCVCIVVDGGGCPVRRFESPLFLLFFFFSSWSRQRTTTPALRRLLLNPLHNHTISSTTSPIGPRCLSPCCEPPSRAHHHPTAEVWPAAQWTAAAATAIFYQAKQRQANRHGDCRTAHHGPRRCREAARAPR